MRIVSIDIETTGLDPSRHETWEIAVAPLDDAPRCYQLPVTLIGAEEAALEVGGFDRRYLAPMADRAVRRWPSGAITTEALPVALSWIHGQLREAQLLGCSVHFDAAFLAELLRRQGFDDYAPWHHRHLDLGSFAAGAWGARHALSSRAMSDRCPNPGAHDAYEDALWNLEVYRRIVSHF